MKGRSRICEVVGCKTHATFGIEIPTRCMEHILPGQENVTGRKCQFTDIVDGVIVKCKKQVYCGFPGGKQTHCIGHKQPGQLNLRDKICQAAGCSKYATFGAPSGRLRDAIHCGEHSESDEVCLRVRYRCYAEGCKRHPRYGLVDQRPRHCELHKLPEEIFRRSHTLSEKRTSVSFLMSYPEPLPAFMVHPVPRPAHFAL